MGLPHGIVIGRKELLRATDLWPAEELLRPFLPPPFPADTPHPPKEGAQTGFEAPSRNPGCHESMLAGSERSPKEASYEGHPWLSFVIPLTVCVMVGAGAGDWGS